jgi:hypothetical protein
MKINRYFIFVLIISSISCVKNINFNRIYSNTKNIELMSISKKYNFFLDSTYSAYGYITQYVDSGRLQRIDKNMLKLCPIIVKMPIKYDLKINNIKLSNFSVEFEFDSTILKIVDIHLYSNGQFVGLLIEKKFILNNINKRDTLNIKFIPKLKSDFGYSLKNQIILSENIIFENNFNFYKIGKISGFDYYQHNRFNQDLKSDTIIIERNKFQLIDNRKKYTYYRLHGV